MRQIANNESGAGGQNTSMHKGNFVAALVLLVLSSGLFLHTLSFPMTGSYGGVENQWFVSPALFPLFVLGILVFLSFVLTVMAFRAVREKREHDIEQSTDKAGLCAQQRHTVIGKLGDKGYIIGLLCSYVYVYIPSADFYLVTCLFLLSLMMRFHVSLPRPQSWALHIHLPLVLVLLGLRLGYDEPFSWFLAEAIVDESHILVNDVCCAAALCILLQISVNQLKSTPKKLLRLLSFAFFIPLIVICLFSFALYVPMPVEYGTVSSFLNYLFYDVIGL